MLGDLWLEERKLIMIVVMEYLAGGSCLDLVCEAEDSLLPLEC